MHSQGVGPRRLVLALLLAVLGGLLAVPAGAADRVVTGTILGSDGRAVSALLGFDLRDSRGRRLGASGCVASPSCPVDGYALTRRINFELGPDGGRKQDWVTTWAVALPEQAVRVYVEAYPQGARYAGTDMRRYAASFRRNLPVPYGRRVNVRLPRVCADGATGTGAVRGLAVDGPRRVRLARVTAFSLEPDDNGPTPVLGTAVGTTGSDGSYTVPNLASGVGRGQRGGQRYQLVATAVDGRVQRVYDVRVTGCHLTTRTLDFSAPAP